MQNGVIVSNSSFKEPVEYILGWSYETSVSDSHIDRVNNTCYVVPLLSSLQSLLNNTSIIEQVILILSMDILMLRCKHTVECETN